MTPEDIVLMQLRLELDLAEHLQNGDEPGRTYKVKYAWVYDWTYVCDYTGPISARSVRRLFNYEPWSTYRK